MSDTTTINSIITKLTSQPNSNRVLIFNSAAANRKYTEFKQRITTPYIDETSFVVLSSFLQNTNLDLFTDEELEVMLRFDYTFVENDIATSVTKTRRNLNKPYYDIGEKIVNIDDDHRDNIKIDFKNRHILNKSLDLEFLAQLIINQV